jgi:oligopeptide/dipeptide ABC transporter ATP-binding protein
MPRDDEPMSLLPPDNVLQVRDLCVNFDTLGGLVEAVRGVSFDLVRGRTLALVGESGSGKSVTSYAILRIIQKPGKIASGQILFRPRESPEVDIAALPDKSETLFNIRGGKIGMIFQEPMTALSPVHTVGNQICEAIRLHRHLDTDAANDLAADMLNRVGIPDPSRRLKQYPFEFSGGMRQRVVIAMALVCRPDILIADEPTTALDVTVQAQILRLINQLREEMGMSVLFITHDLGVVAQVADDVAVMRRGRIVEYASARELFKTPIHPYTRQLLAAVPHADYDERRRELAGPCVLPEPLPQGWGFDDPDDTTTSPKIHRLEGRRELLLWPVRGAYSDA